MAFFAWRFQGSRPRLYQFAVRDRNDVGNLLGSLFSRGLALESVSIREPDLQGVFLKLTGRELRD